MKLNELLDMLAIGELSNISWVNNNKIDENKIPIVVKLINQALDKLYHSFFLKLDQLYLMLIEGKHEYILSSKYNMSDIATVNWDHYIFKGTNDTFKNDIIKITDIVTSTGLQLPINDEHNSLSVFLPAYNVLQIPNFDPRWKLCITYYAKHDKLDYKEDPEKEIELPEHMLPALYNYLAYLVHSNINTQEAVANAQKYLTMYQLIEKDLISTDNYKTLYTQDNTKFKIRGFI